MGQRMNFLLKWLIIRVAVVVIATIALLHPFFHWMEGGSLDAAIFYLEVWASNAIGLLPIVCHE